MKTIKVVAGIIYYKDQILCVQRPENKLSYISEKFEFPGGKIEDGESIKEALERELIEELNMTPKIGSLFLSVNHTYPDFHLIMHAFKCKVSTKELTLNEHIAKKWLKIDSLICLDWAAADVPIVKKLIENE